MQLFNSITNSSSNVRYLVVLSVLFHILTSYFSIGRFHADEQYQILEFAAWKKGVNASKDMPWEFHEKIRPAVQVGFSYMVMVVCDAVNITDPFTQAFLLRLFSSCLGFISVMIMLRRFSKSDPALYKAAGFLSLLWYLIPWFHARYSSESVSTSLFIIGLFLLDMDLLRGTVSLNGSIIRLAFASFLLGLSGVVRFQVNFFLLGFLFWLLIFARPSLSRLLLLFIGVFSANLTGFLIDRWFYGTWEFTTWNYVYQNVFLHKAEQFGKEPIWFYFSRILTDAVPPFSLLILFSFFYYCIKFPRSIITWITGLFFLAHCASSHKEIRFLFPLIPFLPLFLVLAYMDLIKSIKWKEALNSRSAIIFTRIFVIVNTILLFVVGFKPADDYTPVLRFLYKTYSDQNTVMVSEGPAINPYSNKVSLSFYRSSNILAFESVDLVDSLKREFPDARFLYVSGKRDLAYLKNRKLKREYSSLPDWILLFNINGWVDRVYSRTIYSF